MSGTFTSGAALYPDSHTLSCERSGPAWTPAAVSISTGRLPATWTVTVGAVRAVVRTPLAVAAFDFTDLPAVASSALAIAERSVSCMVTLATGAAGYLTQRSKTGNFRSLPK